MYFAHSNPIQFINADGYIDIHFESGPVLFLNRTWEKKGRGGGWWGGVLFLVGTCRGGYVVQFYIICTYLHYSKWIIYIWNSILSNLSLEALFTLVESYLKQGQYYENPSRKENTTHYIYLRQDSPILRKAWGKYSIGNQKKTYIDHWQMFTKQSDKVFIKWPNTNPFLQGQSIPGTCYTVNKTNSFNWLWW